MHVSSYFIIMYGSSIQMELRAGDKELPEYCGKYISLI